MNLQKNEYPYSISLSADDSRTEKYLRGEGIEFSDSELETVKGLPGKCDLLLCVDDFPLGWGKLSGGKMKNKYLPGWRKM